MLYVVAEAMEKPMRRLLAESLDDEGNLPLHVAAAEQSHSALVDEMIFTNLDTVRIPNK
jgi:hypothetical protein